MQMISEFQKFANSMQGKNPNQMIQELLKSGKMSKQQYEQLGKQATQLAQLFKTFGIG